MQNDLKYGKLSEIFGINVYFMGKTRKKSRLRRKKSTLAHSGALGTRRATQGP